MADEELDRLRRQSAQLAANDPNSQAAVAAHSELLAREPGDQTASNRLGIALMNLGRYKEARRVFEEALGRDPTNAIARGRLRDLPRFARRDAEARGVAPGREEWPEWAEDDPDEIRRLFDAGNENWRGFLSVLVAHAPSRLTYEQIEERLGWDRGRLGKVIGGTRSVDGDAPRPYHICSPALSRSGEWEAWMDADQAGALRSRVAADVRA